MSALKLMYFLMAIVHGGPKDAFSLTRLASFSDAAACEAAAQSMSAAMSHAEPDANGKVEIGCIGSDKIEALKRH